jgi:hypothetical protein
MNFCVTKKNSFKIVQMSNETIQKWITQIHLMTF